jgi:hypothetical protein
MDPVVVVERGDVHRATTVEELVQLVVAHADEIASLRHGEKV